MGKSTAKDEQFTDEEAQRRFEQALKGALNTPPKPHKAKTEQKTVNRERSKVNKSRT